MLYSSIGHSIKSFPWHYENEVRLTIEIEKNELTPFVSSYIAEHNDLKGLSLKINAQGIMEKEGRLIYAPIEDTSNLPKGYKPSTLKGELDWDLCKNCTK